MTEQDDRRHALLGDTVYAVAFDIGFNAPAPPAEVAARVTALLAAATPTAPAGQDRAA